ncbi:MAG: PspC domain-containing protein [Balneolales bacterium]|nr:PspC domain-containing protein [Balneolales bacterium]
MMNSGSKTKERFSDSAGKRDQLEQEFNISYQDLENAFEDFVKEEKKVKKQSRGLVNTASIFGGVMLVLTVIMLLQLFGLDIGPELSFTQHIIGPSVLILSLLMGWSWLNERRLKSESSIASKPELKVKPSISGDPDVDDFIHSASQNRSQYSDTNTETYGLRKQKKLWRTRKDKKVSGVCGGLARYFGLDPVIVRIIFGLSLAFYGTPLILYILLAIVIPKAPKNLNI